MRWSVDRCSQLYPKEAVELGDPMLTVEGLSQPPAVNSVSLRVRAGEILRRSRSSLAQAALSLQ